MPPKKRKGPPWLGTLTGIDLVLARLDEIEDKLDEWMTNPASTASLEESLAALKAADKTIDAIEPKSGANPK